MSSISSPSNKGFVGVVLKELVSPITLHTSALTDLTNWQSSNAINPQSSFDYSTGVFTAPEDGIYKIDCDFQLYCTTDGVGASIRFFASRGSIVMRRPKVRNVTAGNHWYEVDPCCYLEMKAGETVKIQITLQASGQTNNGNMNMVIQKVGEI